MLSSLIRPRVYLLIALAASLGSVATRAQAEPVFFSGFGFIQEHPILGDEGFLIEKPTDLPGSAATAIFNEPEADFGLAAGVHIRIDLRSYVTAADKLTLEDIVFDVDTGGTPASDGTITFSFGPADFTPLPPEGEIIGSGDIRARIIGASTTLGGVSVSQFIGGSFQMTFTAAKITAGTGASGGGSIAYAPNSIGNASFSISTPEPASVVLAVMGTIGAMGLCYRMRRA